MTTRTLAQSNAGKPSMIYLASKGRAGITPEERRMGQTARAWILNWQSDKKFSSGFRLCTQVGLTQVCIICSTSASGSVLTSGKMSPTCFEKNDFTVGRPGWQQDNRRVQQQTRSLPKGLSSRLWSQDRLSHHGCKQGKANLKMLVLKPCKLEGQIQNEHFKDIKCATVFLPFSKGIW